MILVSKSIRSNSAVVAKWETFIRDYKGNDKLFKDFSSRWRKVFGIFAEKWKEEKKETIHEKCRVFVEGEKTTDEENATFKSILEKKFSEVSA